MTRILIYAAILLVLAVGAYAAVSSYNSALKRAAQLESDVGTLQESQKEQLADNMWLRVENQRVGSLLAARESKRQGAAEERKRLDEKLGTLFANNQQVREWGNQPVPRALLDSLQLKPAGRLNEDAARNAASSTTP